MLDCCSSTLPYCSVEPALCTAPLSPSLLAAASLSSSHRRQCPLACRSGSRLCPHPRPYLSLLAPPVPSLTKLSSILYTLLLALTSTHPGLLRSPPVRPLTARSSHPPSLLSSLSRTSHLTLGNASIIVHDFLCETAPHVRSASAHGCCIISMTILVCHADRPSSPQQGPRVSALLLELTTLVLSGPRRSRPHGAIASFQLTLPIPPIHLHPPSIILSLSRRVPILWLHLRLRTHASYI
ncbi:hypothetical protein GY45DRAFT_311498 [Cubamyces sp. BRFM 1775]|nr:hypothetical protein GY45DRAFT_311498 [Cubamyces sp. BRFM 1775]